MKSLEHDPDRAGRVSAEARSGFPKKSCSKNSLERDGDLPGAVALEAGFNSETFRPLTLEVHA
jgi:hypothetical protein